MFWTSVRLRKMFDEAPENPRASSSVLFCRVDCMIVISAAVRQDIDLKWEMSQSLPYRKRK